MCLFGRAATCSRVSFFDHGQGGCELRELLGFHRLIFRLPAGGFRSGLLRNRRGKRQGGPEAQGPTDVAWSPSIVASRPEAVACGGHRSPVTRSRPCPALKWENQTEALLIRQMATVLAKPPRGGRGVAGVPARKGCGGDAPAPTRGKAFTHRRTPLFSGVFSCYVAGGHRRISVVLGIDQAIEVGAGYRPGAPRGKGERRILLEPAIECVKRRRIRIRQPGVWNPFRFKELRTSREKPFLIRVMPSCCNLLRTILREL
jgi:hypothetical protein